MKLIRLGMVAVALALCPMAETCGQTPVQEYKPGALLQMTPQELMGLVVEHEQEATKHRGFYEYLSVERSDRTGGHEWTEWMAETPWGKVQYLVAEDGKPLTGARLQAERARIEDEGAHPDAFKQEQAAKQQDEQHARQMMLLLPKAFLFDPPQVEGENVRVHFRPNPEYQPQGLEERVLHTMSGSVLIDGRLVRTRELEGRMPQDLSLGFGLLATIKGGSNFATTREQVNGYDWKTHTMHTDINGKALFLKTIARQQDATHTNFKLLPQGTTVADAVKLLEAEGSGPGPTREAKVR